MELSTEFTTYVEVLNENSNEVEEIKVEVHAEGRVIDNNFTHEFGIEKDNAIDGVCIVSVYDINNEEFIGVSKLSKKMYSALVALAEDELNDQLQNDPYIEEDINYEF